MVRKRVACYVRVSTEGQNQAGQVDAIERWLAGHGIADPLWFTDKATGRNMNRKGFAELERAIFHGEVDTVVVFKLDRLSRSLRDGLNTICDWLERGVRIVATSQQLDYSGTIGKLIASTLFAVAEMENETRKERQAEGIRVAKRNGIYTGRRKGAMGKKTAQNRERFRQLRQKGLTMTEIAQATGVSQATVSRHLAAIDAETPNN